MSNKLLGVVAVHVVIGATISQLVDQLVDQCVLSVLGIALLTLFMAHESWANFHYGYSQSSFVDN